MEREKLARMKNHLSKLRTEQGVSLAALSRMTGISRIHLYYIESGQRTPTVPVAYKIARTLHKTLEEVFPEPK